MAASLAHVFGQMQRWTSGRQAGDASDAVLLERFVQRRDEVAFAALVARHGAMVLRLCRHILGDVQDAEDAFQAAFVILARKAYSLKQPEALPGWLYGVARRVALKARRQSASRSASTTPLCDTLPDPRPDPLAQLTARELLDILDEEVQRLPAAQRSSVVLCCLEGHTQEEAARILGWTPGSVRGRLERGRRRLHARLARRGIALPAVLAIVVVSRGEAASALMQGNAVRAALGGFANQGAALAESVLKEMLRSKIAGLTAFGMTIALAVSAAVALSYPPAAESPAAPVAAPAPHAPTPAARVDALGDPLPDGAVARLGTVRFRHGGGIRFAAFTPGGNRLVSKGYDGVRVWEPATGKQLWHRATAPWRAGRAFDLSPDGKRMAVVADGSSDGIHFWDVETGKKVGSLGDRPWSVVRFSPDGKLLAASPTNTEIELWDLVSSKKLRSWTAHETDIESIAFSVDSRTVLTSDAWGKVRLWETATGRRLQEFIPVSWNAGVISAFTQTALSPDGTLLAILEYSMPAAKAGETKARISIWNAATGKLVRQLTCPPRNMLDDFAIFFALTFTPDGKKLVTSGPDDCLRVWDPNTGEEQRRLPLKERPPVSLAFSKDGKSLAAVSYLRSSIRIVDMTSGMAKMSPGGHLANLNLAILTPDGRTAVTGGLGEPLLVWDVATGRVRQRLGGSDNLSIALRLAGDGRTLFSAGWSQTLSVWDLSTGAERRRIKVNRDLSRVAMDELVVLPDGKTLILIDRGKAIRLLDAATGEEKRHFSLEGVQRMAVTPDGRSLAAWSSNGTIRLWDVATGRKKGEYPLPPVEEGEGRYYSAALSPDGRLLAMGSQRLIGSQGPKRHFLILKDLVSGRDVYRLDKLSSGVDVLAFSPDGRVLAWGGFAEPVIRLLEAASGGERRRLTGHRGAVFSLVFTADGERLISGSGDTTALVWDLGSRFNPRHAPAPLTIAEVEALWADLAANDAAAAYQAIRKLAASPTSAIPFLRKRLPPAPLLDDKRVAHLIANLDSDDFATRQKAVAELEKFAGQPLTAYRRALEGKPSIETRRRLEDLLEKAGPAWWDVTGERLRSLRAVEVLELAGTKGACAVLETIAYGAAGARLTEQARAALERLVRGKREGESVP